MGRTTINHTAHMSSTADSGNPDLLKIIFYFSMWEIHYLGNLQGIVFIVFVVP